MGSSFRQFLNLDEGWFKRLLGFGGKEQPEEDEEEQEQWPAGAVYMQYKDFLNCQGKPTYQYVIVSNPEVDAMTASEAVKAVQMDLLKAQIGAVIKKVVPAFNQMIAVVGYKMQDQIGNRPCIAIKATAIQDKSQAPMVFAALEKMPWPPVAPGKSRKDPNLVMKLGQPGMAKQQTPQQPMAAPKPQPMAKPAASVQRPMGQRTAAPMAGQKPQPMATPAASVQRPQAAGGVKKCPSCGRQMSNGYCMICDIMA